MQECPYEALEIIGGEVIWDKSKCRKCDRCIKVCPINSSPKVQEMGIDEIINKIKKTKSFISGVTISGGECTKQLDFLIQLCKEIKKIGLAVFIDTNGSVPFYENAKLIEVIDMVMLDVKSFDTEEHKMLTGKSNDIVLNNLKYLGEINKLYEVRTVIVPDILDNIQNVDKISSIIATLNPNIKYKLIKYRAIGARTDLINSHSPSDETMNKLREIAEKNGCENLEIL